LRVLRESGCKILEDIKELGRETAASNRRQKTPTLEQGLAIQEFLKKQRRAKPRIALRGKGPATRPVGIGDHPRLQIPNHAQAYG